MKPPRFLTASAIAADLSMSKRHVCRLIQSGAMGTPLRIGPHTIRVKRDDYERYISQLQGQRPQCPKAATQGEQ